MPSQPLTIDVCIVGGGPAGMVLGLLLAEQNISVVVLEAHPDFEREYRGEVLMPRFSQMFQQIGLFDYLLTHPHLKLQNLEMFFKNWKIARVDFSSLCAQAPFALWMPQPVLLNALYEKAKLHPHFKMFFGTAASGIIEEQGAIRGVQAQRGDEKFEVRAKVTVGCDGRNSVIRKLGGFQLDYEKYEFDVVWFTVPKPENYENTVRVFISPHKTFLVLPKYPDSLQCGLIVPKGGFADYRRRGIEALRADILNAHWSLGSFAKGLTDLKDFRYFSVLQARSERVKEWAREGCMLIGDSAHTCSPAGAVGVSEAVATAIVCADVLSKGLKANDVSLPVLNKVQALREAGVRQTQDLQERFITVLFFQLPWLRWLVVPTIFLLDKTGLLRRMQRKLAVMDKPLPV